MRWKSKFACLLLLGCGIGGGSALAESPRDGGPDSVDVLLEDQSKSHNGVLGKDLLEAWREKKQELSEQSGLSFGSDYSSQLLTGSGLAEGASSTASAGMFRFFGKWELVNRGGQ